MSLYDRIIMTIESILKFINRHYKPAVCLFFVSMLILGVCIAGDYGPGWDNFAHRKVAIITMSYIEKGNRFLFSRYNRYTFGSFFQLGLLMIERAMDIDVDSDHGFRKLFAMRSFATFLLFYLSAIAFYFLIFDRFRNWKIAVLGALFYFLSPRIFGHAFVNPKDIPFLSFFTISMFTLAGYLGNKSIFWALFHAITSALLVATRITGIIIPGLTILFIMIDIIANKAERKKLFMIMCGLLLYMLILIPCVVILWPVLWDGPVYHFIEALKRVSGFEKDTPTLYMGKLIVPSRTFLWHYPVVWMAITIPISYLVFFFIGIVYKARDMFFNRGVCYNARRKDVIIYIWFFAPLIAAVFTKANMYNDWRHLLFIYPAFLMFSISGLAGLFSCLKEKRYYKIAIVLLISVNLFQTAGFMLRNHPYQYIYFNELIGGAKGAKDRFEMDFYGLSYREGFEYVAKANPNGPLVVCISTMTGRWNGYYMLNALDRKRIIVKFNPEGADYYIGNYEAYIGEYPYGDKEFTVNIDGAEILSVRKI